MARATHRFQVTLPPDVHQLATEQARENGMSFSAFAAAALRQALNIPSPERNRQWVRRHAREATA